MTARRIELARAGWGAALLLAPDAVLGKLHRVRLDRASRRVVRILGARHLIQAALSGVRPSPAVLAAGVWTDASHALTALAFAATVSDRAAAGLTDAAVATAWAAVGFRDIRRLDVTDAAHERWRDALATRALSHLPGGPPLLRRAAAAAPPPVRSSV